MILTEDWAAILKRSYSVWLGYIAATCLALIAVLNMAPAGTLDPAFVKYWTPWLEYVGLVAGALVPGGRIVKQAGL